MIPGPRQLRPRNELCRAAKAAGLRDSECFEALQERLYSVGLEALEALSEAGPDARGNRGSGAATPFGELDARPSGVVGVDPPLDQPGPCELGQRATHCSRVETEIPHQPTGCVHTDVDGAQRKEVGEVEVCGSPYVRTRIGQHGLVEPEEGVEKPQLRRRRWIAHALTLAASNY